MAVVIKILVIFIMIGVGFFLNKTNVLPEASNVYISKLVILVGSPCMIFDAIVEKELTDGMMRITVQMIMGSILFFLIGSVLAYLIIRLYKIDTQRDAGVYLLMLTTINAGFMGFPVAKAIFGNEGLYFIVLGNIIFNVFLYSFGMVQVKYESKEKQSLRETVKAICNPCIIGSILGFFFLFLHFSVPVPLMDSIAQIADITVPLSMISIGMNVADSSILGIIKNKSLLAICLTKMLLWPVMAFLAITVIDQIIFLDDMVKSVLFLMSALPTAVSAGVLSRRLDCNAQLASEGIILTTLFSMGSIPLASLFLDCFFVN